MFGTNTIGRTLSFGKVLSGISKGLSIANQAIPIYEQVKPMLGNAKKLFSIVKEFKNTPSEAKPKTSSAANPQIKKEEPTAFVSSGNSSNSSLPVFFQ